MPLPKKFAKTQSVNRTRTPKTDKGLHPRNVHQQGYNFPVLVKSFPKLKAYVKTNQYQNESINFSDPKAVKALNAALLKHHYNIVAWDIPEGFLCPPIPGRVDYIHYIADVLNASTTSSPVRMLDIGTGANGIYSLLACQVYGWHCTASDIDPISLNNVANIASNNTSLKQHLALRLQTDKSHIFTGIIQADEYYDVSVCNPPFHASLKGAQKASQRKLSNLARNRKEHPSNAKQSLNFGGQKAELWCKGGENQFLRIMINESKVYANQCRWFTSLVSKSENVKPAKKLLRKLEALNVKVIEMKQGNKITRILAWSFISPPPEQTK